MHCILGFTVRYNYVRNLYMCKVFSVAALFFSVIGIGFGQAPTPVQVDLDAKATPLWFCGGREAFSTPSPGHAIRRVAPLVGASIDVARVVAECVPNLKDPVLLSSLKSFLTDKSKIKQLNGPQLQNVFLFTNVEDGAAQPYIVHAELDDEKRTLTLVADKASYNGSYTISVNITALLSLIDPVRPSDPVSLVLVNSKPIKFGPRLSLDGGTDFAKKNVTLIDGTSATETGVEAKFNVGYTAISNPFQGYILKDGLVDFSISGTLCENEKNTDSDIKVAWTGVTDFMFNSGPCVNYGGVSVESSQSNWVTSIIANQMLRFGDGRALNGFVSTDNLVKDSYFDIGMDFGAVIYKKISGMSDAPGNLLYKLGQETQWVARPKATIGIHKFLASVSDKTFSLDGTLNGYAVSSNIGGTKDRQGFKGTFDVALSFGSASGTVFSISASGGDAVASNFNPRRPTYALMLSGKF